MRTTQIATTTSAMCLLLAAGLCTPQFVASASAAPLTLAAIDGPTVDYRSSDWLRDRKVLNNSNEHIANVSNLIVGRGSGRIDYLVVKTGAILGMGGKEVAIPYGAFQWTKDDADAQLILASTVDQLKAFPEFTAKEWSAMVESKEPRSKLHERLSSDTAKEVDPYSKSFDSAKRGKIEGTITRIDREHTDGYGEHTVITVATADNNQRKIVLGPSWYVNGESVGFSRGDKVVVESLALPRDPNGLSVATSMQVNGRELKLRGTDGAPVWTLKSAEAGNKSYDTYYWRYILLSTLKDAKLDCRGTECGKVNDVIFDRSSGQIAFLSIDPNQNFLGIADTKRLIPWSVVNVAVDGSIRVDASKEMILASIETPKETAVLNTGTRANMVYGAFQVSPPAMRAVKPAEVQAPNSSDAWLASGPIITGIDRSSTKTVTGTISDITEVSFTGGVQPARAIKIKTGTTTETFLLGPAWYMTKQKTDWKTGDPISAEVSRTTINGAQHWLIRSAEVKGNKVECIDSGGTPAWDSKR